MLSPKRLISIPPRDAAELIKNKYIKGPVFEEHIRTESGFLYDTLRIRHFSPERTFWRKVHKSAEKHNCEVIVTNHYLSLIPHNFNRTYVEGCVSYYNSTKALELLNL
jgi:hypothetical protein